MVWMNPVLEFHNKLSTYDRANWEVIVEKQKATHASNNNLNNNITHNYFPSKRNELIDVDLVLGTTFSKAKPTYHFGTVSFRALFKIIFFPVYYRWWSVNLPFGTYMYFFTVYLGFLWAFYVCVSFPQLLYSESCSMLISTFIALIILGELFVHVVSTNLTKPSTSSSKKVSSISKYYNKKRDTPSSNDDYISLMSPEQPGNTFISMSDNITETPHKHKHKRDKLSSKHSPPVQMQRSSSADQLRTITNENVEHTTYYLEPLKLHSNSIDYIKDESEIVASSSTNSTNVSVVALQRDMDLSAHVTSSSSSISDNEGTHRTHDSLKLPTPTSTLTNTMWNKHEEILVTPKKEKELIERPAVRSTMDYFGNDHISTMKIEAIEEDWPERNTNIFNKIYKSIQGSSMADNFQFDSPNSIVKSRFIQNPSVIRSTEAAVRRDYLQEISNVKAPFKDQITVTLFDDNGHPFRVKLTLLELSAYIDDKVKRKDIDSRKTVYGILLLALVVSVLPLVYHIFSPIINDPTILKEHISKIYDSTIYCMFLYNNISGRYILFVFLLIYIRFALASAVFFLLTVAERALKVKYIYAKCFTALTSGRRAKRNRLPHFRLHKVRNIKVWLSLRSYIKRCGPVRSVELIVSATLFISVILIVILCYLLLSIVGENSDNANAINKFSEFITWDISLWGLFLTYYLMCFLSLSFNINKKFQNHSELITEQINLYLKMEQNDDKKDNLIICNNVLKLASKLLKDLEPPKKVTMLLINPFFVNLLRVIFLSFFSALISEIFGIRFKLWKIKA